jgi:hypothetical protein
MISEDVRVFILLGDEDATGRETWRVINAWNTVGSEEMMEMDRRRDQGSIVRFAMS